MNLSPLAPLRSTRTTGPARRRVLGAAVAVSSALVLAACGSGDAASSSSGSDSSSSASGGSGGSGGSTKISVGVIPIVDVAPIYLGKEKGFFSDEGLDLTLESAQGGAAIVPGVTSGQFQFGFSNNVSLLLASSKGLGIKMVSNGVAASEDPAKDFGGIAVKKDGGIASFKDLVGKKIGVNTLTTTIHELVRKAGGDPSSIKYVELGFPDITPALERGDIDAGQLVEPFLTLAKNAGHTNIGSNYAGLMPGLTVATYFTSDKYAKSDPKIVESFTKAMKKSLAYAQAHPDEARSVLGTYTKIDPKVAAEVTLPSWPEEINKESVQKLSDLAQQDKLLTKAPDLTALLP